MNCRNIYTIIDRNTRMNRTIEWASADECHEKGFNNMFSDLYVYNSRLDWSLQWMRYAKDIALVTIVSNICKGHSSLQVYIHMKLPKTKQVSIREGLYPFTKSQGLSYNNHKS